MDVGEPSSSKYDHLGSVVRYGPNRLIFNSAQALKGSLPGHDHYDTHNL